MRNLQQLLKKNPLFFAFFLPAIVDGTVTILGQSPKYWQPNRVVNEASPAYYFLAASPWLFIIGSIFWFVIWYWLFKKLPEMIRLFLAILFIAGHSWGSGSWIMRMMREKGIYSVTNQPSVILAWCLLIIYFAVIAFIASYCLSIHYHRKFSLKSSAKNG